MRLVKRIFKGQALTLRAKTLVFVSLTLVGLLLVLLLISQSIYLKSFAEAEKRDTTKNVERALNAVSGDISEVETTVGDWAPWDDTYAFVEDVNETYIESNLIDDTFANLGLNLMVFTNSSGQIVFGKAFDLLNEQEVPVAQSIEEQLSPDSILVNHTDTGSIISGLVLLDEGPMLIASHPILTSGHEGPIHGALIMGRYLDSTEIEGLSESIRLSITLHRVDEPQMPPDFEVASTSLSDGEPIFVRPIDNDSIGGYALLKDIYGNPVLVLRTDMPRDIYHQGQTNLLYLLLSLFGVGLVFGLVTLLIVEKSLLSPLSRLSSSVIAIGKRGDPSARIAMSGGDELSRLGGEINGMLEALQKSKKAQSESEEQYSTLVGSLTDSVFKIKGDEIEWCNDRISEIFGYTKEELTGRKARVLFPVDVSAEEFAGGVSAEIKKRGFFCGTAKVKRKDWSLVDIEYTISQIHGKKPVELVAVARDVTERRLAEEALQRARNELEIQVKQRTSELVKANEKLAHEIDARRQAEDSLRYSEEYLRVLMENALDVILVTNADGTIRYASASFDQMIGESRASKYPFEFVHPEDMQYAMETLGQLISKSGITIQTEIRGQHRDGSWHTFEVMARNLLDHPVVKGILVNFHDITERKRLEQERAKTEALQESGEKLRRLIEEMDDGYCVIQDYKVVFVNSRGAEMFGYRPEEATGKTIRELLPSKMAEELVGIYRDAENSGTLPSKHPITLMRKDGTRCTVELGARFTEYAGKKAVSFVIRDITERKRMEEVLHESEERFREVLEHSLDMIYSLNLQTGKYGYVSPSSEKLLGYSPEEFLALNQDELISIVHPDDAEKLEQNIADLITHKEGSVLSAEYRVKHKDLGYRWVSDNRSVVYDEGNIPIAIVGSLRDIDERKRIDEGLRESEERFRNVLNNSLDMIYRFNLQAGKYEYVSPASKKILGYDPEELIGPGLEKTRGTIYPDDLGRLDENAIELLCSKEDAASSIEYRIKHKELGYRWVNDSRSLVYGEGNVPIAIVGSIRDIDERRQAEEKLKQLMAELARSNTELEQFAYVASHDLQEPLRMVASYTQMLARRYKGKLDADADEFINYAVGGATRMQQLLDALLTYSRVGTRGKPFEPTECETVFGHAVANLQAAIKETDAVVTHDSLPTVKADATQMVQLFQNLIGNAIKFHGDKRPEVHVGAERNGTEWIFSVRDNGIGIDPKYFDRIFVIFQQLHSREEYPGTGIGLTVCKKIVERHKGRIWVESQPGNGATFYFTIPDEGGKS